MSVEISPPTAKISDSLQNLRVYDDFPTSHLRFECRRAEGLVAAAFNLAMVRAFRYQGEK
jgi:hypothetical protein